MQKYFKAVYSVCIYTKLNGEILYGVKPSQTCWQDFHIMTSIDFLNSSESLLMVQCYLCWCLLCYFYTLANLPVVYFVFFCFLLCRKDMLKCKQIVKLTLCLVTEQQDNTSFKNSKSVTVCSSTVKAVCDPCVLFRTFQHRLCFSICNSQALRLRIKVLSSL